MGARSVAGSLRHMHPARRTALGVGAFAGLEALLATYVLLAVGSARMGLFIAACSIATAALAIALDRLLRPAPPAPDGGGGSKPAPVPPPEPSWWPAFERDLGAYTDSRRSREPSAPR